MRAGRAGLIGLGAAGLVLAGCHPARFRERRNEKPLLVSSRLTCPDHQGDLERKDEAADGRSCRYLGDDGTEVTLQLASLDGRTAQAALTDMETKLKATLPNAPASPADKPGTDAAGNTTEAKDDDADGEHTTVNLPFLHIETHGDKTRVNMPGLHVNANGEKDAADVNLAGLHVHADDSGAEIRTGGIGPKNVDATYILATKTETGAGDSAAGYVARGPVAGPLVVATIRGRSDSHGDEHDVFHAAKRLVNRNVRRS